MKETKYPKISTEKFQMESPQAKFKAQIHLTSRQQLSFPDVVKSISHVYHGGLNLAIKPSEPFTYMTNILHYIDKDV